MRRSDREITDIKEIEELLGQEKILRLGLNDDGYPYVVPLHYGFEMQDNGPVFYMHSAQEGHKLDLIREDGRSFIEIDHDGGIVSGGDIACKYGARFASFMAKGKAAVVTDGKKKVRALQLLMKHQTGRDFPMDTTMAEKVAVICFTAESFSAKARK